MPEEFSFITYDEVFICLIVPATKHWNSTPGFYNLGLRGLPSTNSFVYGCRVEHFSRALGRQQESTSFLGYTEHLSGLGTKRAADSDSDETCSLWKDPIFFFLKQH